MWEKKDDSGGIHDKDNVYNWEAVRCEQNLNGTILTGFLPTLNAGDGFAGYTDWRIPNRFELESLLSFADPTIPENTAKVYPVFQTGCEAACTVTTCSCTAPLATWTSTDEIAGACLAYLVDFYSTLSTSDWKDVEYPVRAVRTAF